jgi:hypothetical protein
MMKLRILVAALLTLGVTLSTPRAGILTPILFGRHTAVAPSYTGPGDVVSGATAWWSCVRAYDAAVASPGTNNACALRRSSDNGTCTVLLAASGLVDYTVGTPCSGATALAWMTRGTFSGAIASTTLTTTGDPCTATSGDQIIGVGITSPTTISSVSSCSAGAGSYVISASYTISAETITDLIPTFVSTAYDQTAGNACSSASCNAVQATSAAQPNIYMDCIDAGTLPCVMAFSGALLETAHNFAPNAAAQLSMSAVENRATGTGSFIFITELGPSNFIGTSTANLWRGLSNGTTVFSFTATDAVFHAANMVLKAGTSADVINLDGTETTGTGTPGTTSGLIKIFTSNASTNYSGEAGLWDNVFFSPTQRTNECANQAAFYGTTIGANC